LNLTKYSSEFRSKNPNQKENRMNKDYYPAKEFKALRAHSSPFQGNNKGKNS